MAVTRSSSVPSSATSAASAVADSSTSAAAIAGAARRSARQIALPVLLGITSLPHLGLLLGESPCLQILLARAEGVEQPLGLGPIQGLLAAGFGGRCLRLLLGILPLLLRCMALGIVLLLWVRLLAGRCFLRNRLLLLPGSIALLRLGLLLRALLPRLVLARFSHRVLARLPLRAQQQFQVHLRVHVVRVQREGGAVLADGLVRLAHRLGRERQLVGCFRLQRRVRALSYSRRAPSGSSCASSAFPWATSLSSRSYSPRAIPRSDFPIRARKPGGSTFFATTTTRSGAASRSASTAAVMRPSGATAGPRRAPRRRRAARTRARRTRRTCRRTGRTAATRTRPSASSLARAGTGGPPGPRLCPAAGGRCRARSARAGRRRPCA